METTSFESWAIVEVMGHNTYAGKVSEQTVSGCGFIRVDVPELPDGGKWQAAQPAFTKLIGTGSIYAITPCSEEVARKAAARVRSQPITMLDIAARPALAAAATNVDDEDDDVDF